MNRWKRSVTVALVAVMLAAAGVSGALLLAEQQRCKTTTAPQVLMRQVPKPPPEFWANREDQEVTVVVLVEGDGSSTAKAVTKSPGRNYTEAAVEAIKHWTFEPGTCDGRPVQMPLTTTVRFEHDREHR
jgi:TonB family protein